jgi:hypothetical protein
MPTLQITLNRDGVAAPVHRAAMVCTDVVAAALTAFAEGRLIRPTMPNQDVRFEIRGPEIRSDERRRMYESWLLAKGFQDLARGVRESLEEAALYLALISRPPKRISVSRSWEEILDDVRTPITKLNFPNLLCRVNKKLKTPIQFEKEFLSIQRVRNCLEHRGGVVRKQDLDNEESTLTLSFPRWKIFYMRGNEEIELAGGERVDDGSSEPDVQILGRIATRTKTYRLGERITFGVRDFMEIAMACSLLGSQLADGLPLV